MLENLEILERIVKEAGAKPTDLQFPERVEHLCGKGHDYAAKWASAADQMWKKDVHERHEYENYKMASGQ